MINEFLNDNSIFDTNLEVYHHKATAPNAPVVVYCHGVSAPLGTFECLYEDLKEFDFYEFSLPGHNDLPCSNSDLNIVSIANKIVGWIRFAKLQKVVLIGHSMGGAICGIVASILGPEIIKDLILVAPYNAKCANPVSFLAFKMFFNTKKFRKQIAKLDPTGEQFRSDQEFTRLINTHPGELRELTNSLTKIASLKAASNAYKKLNVPTTLITGEHDYLVPSKPTTRYLKRIINNLQAHEIKNAPHLVFYDYPKEFMKIVNSVINRNSN